jgi:carbamoylphosphate synthase large subunit
MNKYNLIALDIIEGLDDNFYIVDINGLIGATAILKYKKSFDDALLKIFGEVVNIECSSFVKKHELLKRKTNSNIIIQNNGFIYENKLKWRKYYNLPCPKINEKVKPHNHPDYPKYIVKPEFSFKGRGIVLSNNEVINTNNKFIEEFIPSKLINGYCYSIRVIVIINKNECHPLLFLNRICEKPIIKNLHRGELTEEENLSYISNLNIGSGVIKYEQNKNNNLKEFIKKINFYVI